MSAGSNTGVDVRVFGSWQTSMKFLVGLRFYNKALVVLVSKYPKP